MEATDRLCPNDAPIPVVGPAPSERQPDPRIWAMPPHFTISYGYTLYKAYSKRKGSTARREAREIVHDMKRAMKVFPPESPEGMYLLAVRQAAVSFANGIRRNKSKMSKKLRAARLDMQRFRDKYKRDQRLGYALSTGMKLLLLGGFTWAIVKTLLMTSLLSQHMNPASGGTGGMDPQYVSLSFALGMALVSAYLRGWTQDRTIGKALEKYESRLDKASEEYVDGVIAEYRFAANEAQVAWNTMTHMPAPTTPAFDNLLLDLFCGHTGSKGKKEKATESVEAPKLSMRKRLTALVTGKIS